MFIRKEKPQQQDDSLILTELFSRYEKYVLAVESSRWKRFVLLGLVVSAILIAAASLPFTFISTWIYAVVGAPAGIILFFLMLGAVYRTGMRDWALFQMRETRSFRSRTRIFIVIFIIFLAIFIPAGHYVPYGVGGSIIIILALTAFASLRRTDIEREYVKRGIPDPRDILEDRISNEDEQVVYREEEPPAHDPGQPVSGRIQ